MKQLPNLPAAVDTNESAFQSTSAVTAPEFSGRMDRKRSNQIHKDHMHRHAKRPPLDDAERHTTVQTIMQGLKGFTSLEEGARVATSLYDADWFEAEPDSIFADLFVRELLETFGSSPSANVTLWKSFLS